VPKSPEVPAPLVLENAHHCEGGGRKSYIELEHINARRTLECLSYR
jgi:hypothetical protein